MDAERPCFVSIAADPVAADEQATADPGLRAEMIALVGALRREQGLTLLISIHTPEDLAETAELMAFVAEGRVLAVAPPEEMLRPGRNPAIDRFLGH